jgi:signal recognition particle GTPase
MSSYRLQAQIDVQVVDSILSFLSTLYADIEDSVESSDDGEQGNVSRIAQIRNEIEHLESQVVLDSTPWKEALRKLKDLIFINVTSYTSMHHYERDESCVDRSDIHRNSFHTETISASVANPVAHSESVMDAVECFLKTDVANETKSLSFLLVVGPEGSGKTFTCDEIENMIQTKDYPIEGMRQ